jgi:hypothetical protein
MNTLWTFGDSMTAGDGCIENKPIRSGGLLYYTEYKKEGDDIWPNLLAKELDYEIKNCGISGASNDKIIDKIIDEYDNFKENDVVIMQKTFTQRFDIADIKSNTFQTQHAESLAIMNEVKQNKNSLEVETIINYAAFFADNVLVRNRYNKRFNFLKKMIENKINICFMWDIIDFGIKQETIKDHTNGKINDLHWGFNGHKNFANLLKRILFDSKTII